MLGFMWYQSKQFEKQAEYQAYQDSVAAAGQLRADSVYAAMHPADTSYAGGAESGRENRYASVYRDSLLELASSAEGEVIFLDNGKLSLGINTKGAQPYSAHIKGYTNYGGSDLYLFNGGGSEMGYSIYTGENINTKDFVFKVASKTDTSVVLRLPFEGGGYIQQTYTLDGSYHVDNVLSFVGMEDVIPRNVTQFDMDWSVRIPRMEKGYKNESQYSMLNYYFSGDKKPESFGRGRSSSKKIDSRLSWFAFHQQFFSAIMRARNEFSTGDLSLDFIPETDGSHDLMICRASMRYEIDRNGNSYGNEFYFGPNHFTTLKSFDQKYEKIIPLGGSLVGWFTRFVIIPLFNFLHRFISNFGIIILLMTIFIKIVVLPFAYKSFSSSAKMQAIRPEIEKINEKYPKAEDAMKKQQATMNLYRRAGINPMGGCLPMLLQFPILWAMFRFFPASIELRQQHFLWADDLSAYDSIVDFGFSLPLIGNHLSLFALLMAVSMFFYSRVTMQGQANNDPSAASMRFMSLYMMPVMMFFICNSLSAGLSYYYLLSNLITMAETWIIRKFFVNPDEILARLKASEGKKAPKSKWEQKMEQMQKMQQQALKEQQRYRK